MKITVIDWDGRENEVEGDQTEVKAKLVEEFPFLQEAAEHLGMWDFLQYINSQGYLSTSIDSSPEEMNTLLSEMEDESEEPETVPEPVNPRPLPPGLHEMIDFGDDEEDDY